MGDKLQEMVANEKERKQKAKDQRSLETEKEGIRKQLERHLVEEEGYGKQESNKNIEQMDNDISDKKNETSIYLGPDHIPEATESVEQVITPRKNERIFLQSQTFRIGIVDPVSIVREVLPTTTTPHKQLAAAPSEESDTDTGGLKRTGININDDIKCKFLSAWIKWSEAPFSFCLSENKRIKVKNSIEHIIR